MKFIIPLSGNTIFTIMRKCGYAPESPDLKTTELRFHRLIGGRRYPKFHLYCKISPEHKTVLLNLHLDQKQPSYKGTHAHSGEYEGPLLEAEVARIQHALL
ncbi:MAG: hypothetical protein AAB567_00865 [Patescibacteria group bacterium]